MRGIDKDADGIINREEFMNFFLNRFRKNHESGRPMFLQNMITRTGIKGGVQDIELVDRILFGVQQIKNDDLIEDRYNNQFFVQIIVLFKVRLCCLIFAKFS